MRGLSHPPPPPTHHTRDKRHRGVATCLLVVALSLTATAYVSADENYGVQASGGIGGITETSTSSLDRTGTLKAFDNFGNLALTDNYFLSAHAGSVGTSLQ